MTLSPREKSLLTILGFVVFTCGMVMLILSQVDDYYQEKDQEAYSTVTTHGQRPLKKFDANMIVHPTSDAVAGWKTYQNNKYGFVYEYPADITVIETEKGTTVVFPQQEVAKAPKDGKPIYDRLNFNITYDTDHQYNDIQSYISQLYSHADEAKLWNYELGKVLKINGEDFYPYSWMHQGRGIHYLNVHKKQLVDLAIASGDTSMTIENFSAYATVKRMVTSFKFTK